MLSKYWLVMITVIVAILAIGCEKPETSCSKCSLSQPKCADELLEAVNMATSVVVNQGHLLEDFTVVSAQQIFHQGKYIWRITLKPSRLLPQAVDGDAIQPIGKGGEIFVNVDLATQQTQLTFGE